IRETDYDAIVSDIKMPGMDGLALLHEIRDLRPATPTLMITGHGERDLAVQALRGGAYDFVQKPIDRDYFVASLERAIQLRRLDRQREQQRLALERHARVAAHAAGGDLRLGSDAAPRRHRIGSERTEAAPCCDRAGVGAPEPDRRRHPLREQARFRPLRPRREHGRSAYARQGRRR